MRWAIGVELPRQDEVVVIGRRDDPHDIDPAHDRPLNRAHGHRILLFACHGGCDHLLCMGHPNHRRNPVSHQIGKGHRRSHPADKTSHQVCICHGGICYPDHFDDRHSGPVCHSCSRRSPAFLYDCRHGSDLEVRFLASHQHSRSPGHRRSVGCGMSDDDPDPGRPLEDDVTCVVPADLKYVSSDCVLIHRSLLALLVLVCRERDSSCGLCFHSYAEHGRQTRRQNIARTAFSSSLYGIGNDLRPIRLTTRRAPLSISGDPSLPISKHCHAQIRFWRVEGMSPDRAYP